MSLIFIIKMSIRERNVNPLAICNNVKIQIDIISKFRFFVSLLNMLRFL